MPIGRLASLVRLWERARKLVMEKWRGTCRRECNWMHKGRGSERSVWAQAIYEEAAAASDRSTASVFLDLVKAFEQVALGQVWRSGAKHRVPQRVLSLALEACAFTRRLSYRGAVSREAHTTTAILADSGFATDLLFVTLVEAVGEILLRHERADTRTTLRCFMMVDDVRLTVEGQEDCVADTLPLVAEDVVSILEGCLNMQVSRDSGAEVGKIVAQASSPRLGKWIRPRLKRLWVNIAAKVKNLGVQFAVGSKRLLGSQVAHSRLGGLRKVRRAAQLGRVVGRIAIRSILTPSFTYGSSTTSCPPRLVKQLRVHTARTYGPMGGRSTTARLLLEEADVSQTLAVKTVMSWVQGVWGNLVERDALIQALRKAWTSHIATAGIVRGVLSGGVAYLSALGQLGRAASFFDSVRARSGDVVFLGGR